METLFEYYIETDAFHLKYAKGEPAVKEQEFHDYNEFVFFLSGSSFFISKNIQQELAPGSLILIPKENFHQFCVKNPKSYVRLILAFRDTAELSSLTAEIMDTVKVISEPDERVVSEFEHLMEIVTSALSDDEKKLYIRASLHHLMIHLKMTASDAVCNHMRLSPVVRQALAIIDEAYTENLSVKSIAEALFVSPSTLAHKFSKELHISVYQYLIKKRLSAAHNLITHGETLSAASAKSGFRDYSCFYRLYKKYYPS
ncbi:MAG: helix-turn-helix domain-containing protein [Clostridia bacterium]|nr:helix-turn-helix domain-containing protein [Clostridia bacterium]